jgi:hypothetical protein
MSKLARVLAVGALLTVMSLDSAAHAQTSASPSQPASGIPSQPAGATQPGPTPPVPQQLTVSANPAQGRPGTTVAVEADLSHCPGATTANGVFIDHADRIRPLASQLITRGSRFFAHYTVTAGDAVGSGRFQIICLHDATVVGRGTANFQVLPGPTSGPVIVAVSASPAQGQPGTTVTLTADLGRCPQLTSANGVFIDHADRSRPLASQLITRASSFTARYTVTARDAVGQGRFQVVCSHDATTVGRGSVNFQVLQRPLGPVIVAVSPPAGRPGTVVTVTAQIPGGCASPLAFFQDRKGLGVSNSARRATIVTSGDRQLVARYTIANNDAVGKGRFGVACDPGKPTVRVGYATFQVQTPAPPSTHRPTPPTGGAKIDYSNGGTIQLPDQIDTGLGGTVDRGLDPVWMLLPAGLVLIAAALGLRLRQTSKRRP